jgi:hypothetical protein
VSVHEFCHVLVLNSWKKCTKCTLVTYWVCSPAHLPHQEEDRAVSEKKGPNLSKKKGRSRSQVAVLLRSEPPTRRYAVDSAFTGSSAAAGEGPTSEEHRMGTTIVGVSYNVMAAASSAPTRGQAPLRSDSSSTYARAAGNLRPCFHLRFCVYAGTFGMLLALVEWWVSEVKHILQFLLSVKSML